MPESLVINLVSESTIPQHYLKGQYLHRLFLALVSAVDVDLSQTLQTVRRSAFTLSPLQTSCQTQPASARNLRFLLPRQPLTPFQYTRSSVPAGSHCWWRISLLDDALFAKLALNLERVAAGRSWYLGPARLHVTNFLPANVPEWTSQSTYQELYEGASETRRSLTFELITPAVFRQDDQTSPLPTRDAIFHGLRKRWNRYSGLVFAPDLIAPLTATSFALHTVKLPGKRPLVGCLGKLTFHIADSTDPLTIKRINALAEFSRYCGIGHQTTSGLGMVRTTVTE